MCKGLIFAMIFVLSVSAYAIPKSGSVEDVWPYGKMPGNSTDSGQVVYGRENKLSIKNVSNPNLQFYLVKSDKPQGAVIVCPGGGYGVLAYDHEGTNIAKMLNDAGISAIILKYRVPLMPDEALMDIKRAVRLCRANAKNWNIDPDKIAVMGFSAGGNLCARLSSLYAEQSYTPIDDADKFSARPDLVCLIYPAYCCEPNRKQKWENAPKWESKDYNSDYELAKGLRIDSSTPATFIMQTQEDYLIDNAIAYYLALKKAKVPTVMHLFDEGKHGVGVIPTQKLVGVWPKLCVNWLKANGINGK